MPEQPKPETKNNERELPADTAEDTGEEHDTDDGGAEEPARPKRQKKPHPQHMQEIPHDLRAAGKLCRERAQALAKRSIAVAVLTLAALYLSCAADFGAPLPAVLDYAGSPMNVLITLTGLLVLSMLLAYDVVVGGIRALLHGMPNFATLVDVMLLANLAHAISCIVWLGEELPYLGIAMLALFAQMRAEVSDASARHYLYKSASRTEQPSGVFVHDADGEPLLVMAPLDGATPFLRCEAGLDQRQRIERILTILAVAIAAVLSVTVCVMTGDSGRLPYVLAATLTGACQLAMLRALATGERNAYRRMMKLGGAVAGLGGAGKLTAANNVVLTDTQLFPRGFVRLERLELRGSLNDTAVVAYAAALAKHSSLGEMLEEEVRTRYAASVAAQHVVHYTNGGVRGRIGGIDVLLGDETFLEENGVDVRDVPRDSILLAVAGQMVAVLHIEYQVSAAQFNAVQLLMERHMSIVLHSRNRQVTPQMVERLYGLPEGSVTTAPLERDRAMSSADFTRDDLPCALLARDSLPQLAGCAATAGSLHRLGLAALALGALAAVIGMLLMAYLCFVFVPADARPIRVLLYMILWFIPIFFIENEIGRE